MALRRTLATAAATAALIGGGLMTAPLAQAEGRTPAVATTETTQAASASKGAFHYYHAYWTGPECTTMGEALIGIGATTRYQCESTGWVYVLYIWY